MLVASANELVFLFVGLELVSIPTYLLLYLSRRNPTTQEAATKYFFLSIFSSGLLLYGLAFLYGTTGISNLKALAYLIDKLPNIPQAQLGLLALVSGAGGSLLPGRGRAPAFLRAGRLSRLADRDRRRFCPGCPRRSASWRSFGL